MDNRIKVFNRRKHDIAVTIPFGDRKITHIIKGSTKKSDGLAFLSQDELTYLQMTTNLFTDGKLYLEEEAQKNLEEELEIDTKENPGFMNDEEIEKFIQSKSAPKLKEWLDKIQDEALLFQIYEVQKNMDLNRRKLKVLEDKMPNYFANEEAMKSIENE